MDLQLKGKTALITGSTAGIGFAIAASLATEGAKVIVNGRKQDRVDAAVEQIGNGAVGVASDVGTRAGTDLVIERFPKVDILINNTGIYEARPFESIPDEEWARYFELNVMSGVRLTRHYLPLMKQQNWGRIIFISSESGVQIPAEMIHYGFTKTAQIAIARGLAETTAGTGVTVNSVLPGPTASEGVGDFVEGLAKQQNTDRESVEKEFFRTMRPTSLLQRLATSEEVASIVTFVASPLSSATNGAPIRVEGGVVRSIL